MIVLNFTINNVSVIPGQSDIIWLKENRTLLHATNKDADQPVHRPSLISALVVFVVQNFSPFSVSLEQSFDDY